MPMLNKYLLGLGLLALSASATAVRITPAHSGSWYDPVYDKQGFVIEVLQKADNGPERLASVQWYTYDAEGNPVWAVGLGTTDGDTLAVTLQRAFGGAPPPAQVPASELIDFADVVFTFGNCSTAQADFELLDDGSVGHYDLVRLTQIGATTCTGGISDDVEPGAEEHTSVLQLTPASSVPGAQGTVMFKLRPAFASFAVDLRRLPAGEYRIAVGGELRGTVTVAAMGNGNGATMGQFELRSPEGADGLLDFDPRGLLIEVLNADDAVVLSGTLN